MEHRVRRRSDIDITADIIRVAQENHGAKKTWLVYQANMNFQNIKEYLKNMMDAGLLKFDGKFYHATDKGEEFLKRYEGLTALSA